MRLRSFLGKRTSNQTYLGVLFGRGNALVFTVLGLGLVLIGMLAWDISVFYAVRNAVTSDATTPLPARILQEKDIDEIIKLLDDRARALDALLSPPQLPTPLPSATASSTPPVL
ncbi:MAG: hypothetical protein U1A26_02670 [Candidatus Sungbacteria bacterium]|nr:hypothetical protein [Candidatus Sungbacteria bacterium]